MAEEKIAKNSYILFASDGSTDATWQQIAALHGQHPGRFRGLRLSRNFGHQPALLAGLHAVNDAGAVISIDADLQDDLAAIPEMIARYREGYDVVYGVRDSRKTDTAFKRRTALLFYKMLHRMGVESVYNHADYRLLSYRVLEALKDFKEASLYLRGMVPMLGFAATQVYYSRGARYAGNTKYTLGKMLSFAWSGISSLSVRPLHFVTFCGFFIFFCTIGFSGYALITWFMGNAEPGWASTVIPLYFLGGIQLLCIGLIGEYVGKIYTEVKRRPRYIVEQELR